MDDMRGADIVDKDLTGARLQRIRLNGARIRTAELTGAVVRDAELVDASIDGADISGLRINGVEVAPFIEAELTRREPARALRRSSDPAELRAAWAMLEQSWARTYAWIDDHSSLADRRIDDEWSFTETLRHLVMATDIWLGAKLGNEPRFHPWGLLFTGYEEFVPGGPETFGLDAAAEPSYADVLAVRRQRVASVSAFLDAATEETLAEEIEAPPWSGVQSVSVLRCLWVVLNEEIEHHRFAERDLEMLAAAGN